MDAGPYAEQLALEYNAIDIGIGDYRRRSQAYEQKGRGALLTPSKRLLVHWFKPLCRLISAEKAGITAGRAGVGRAVYGPYLLMVPTDKLAVITMHEVVSIMLAEPLGEKVIKIVGSIARAVNAQINFEGMRRTAHSKDASRDDWAPWDELIHIRNRMAAIHPKMINRVAQKHKKGARWSRPVQTHLGACLLQKLLRVATCGDYGEPMIEAFRRWRHNIVPLRAAMLAPTNDFLRFFAFM